MTENSQDKDARPATSGSKRPSRVGHWLRIAVSILTGGFVFPHAFTEYDDIAPGNAGNHSTTKKP